MPSGGSSGNVLKKTNSGVEWGEMDISGCEVTTNKVSSISSSSDNGQYPSAKCVYDALEAKVPSSGTTGYVLKKTASGTEWASESGGSSGEYFFTFTINYTDTFTVSGFPSYSTLKAQLDSNKNLIGYGMINSPSAIWVFNLNKRDNSSSPENLVFTFTDLTTGSFDIIVNSSGITTLYRLWSAFESSSRKVTSWQDTTDHSHYPSEKLVKTCLDAKISNPYGGSTGNVLKKTANGVEWGEIDISGCEVTTNKVSSWSTTTTNTKYPSEKLVKDSLDAKITNPSGGVNGNCLKMTSDGIVWGSPQYTPTTVSATLSSSAWSSNS